MYQNLDVWIYISYNNYQSNIPHIDTKSLQSKIQDTLPKNVSPLTNITPTSIYIIA